MASCQKRLDYHWLWLSIWSLLKQSYTCLPITPFFLKSCVLSKTVFHIAFFTLYSSFLWRKMIFMTSHGGMASVGFVFCSSSLYTYEILYDNAGQSEATIPHVCSQNMCEQHNFIIWNETIVTIIIQNRNLQMLNLSYFRVPVNRSVWRAGGPLQQEQEDARH